MTNANPSLAIMQPYFLPYIGYFQLISAVDLFVIYDNIKYTKKGWINRNRILQNGKDTMITLPLKNDSDYLNVCERELAIDFNPNKLVNQIKGAYVHAPYFNQTFPLIEEILLYKNLNLFQFIHNSIVKLCGHLDIVTKIVKSSDILIDHGLKCQDKVLELCKSVEARTYINPVGGLDLYSKDQFYDNGIELRFLRSNYFEYKQSGNHFVPSLSIIDVLMFNPRDVIKSCLADNYELV